MANKNLFVVAPRLKSELDPATSCIPGESREEFAALQTEYFDLFAPADVMERFYVDDLIRNEWSIRRWRRVEGQLEKIPGGERNLPTLLRMIGRLERSCKRTRAMLNRFQKERRKALAAMPCPRRVM